MFASDAEITGVINANSGRIGQFNIQGSSLIASSTGQPVIVGILGRLMQ